MSQNRVSEIIGNFRSEKIDNAWKSGKSVSEIAEYNRISK